MFSACREAEQERLSTLDNLQLRSSLDSSYAVTGAWRLDMHAANREAGVKVLRALVGEYHAAGCPKETMTFIVQEDIDNFIGPALCLGEAGRRFLAMEAQRVWQRIAAELFEEQACHRVLVEKGRICCRLLIGTRQQHTCKSEGGNWRSMRRRNVAHRLARRNPIC